MSRTIPNTNTTVSYSYSLWANNKRIGTLQGFTATNTRLLDRVREIGGTGVDDIKEIVPGRGEITLRIERLETYNSALLEAFGYKSDVVDLSQLTDPITIAELRDDGSGNTRTIYYENCVIQSCAKTIREGTITVGETVEMWPTRITLSASKALTPTV